MNIFVVGGDTDYASWIPSHRIVDSVKQADIVLFTGGEDVTPALYGDSIGAHTHFNSARDAQEYKVFESALLQKKKMLGICRGSQLLCALSGGKLVQHQENKELYHPIETSDGCKVVITSTHHQAQYPYDMAEHKYKLLAWTEGISKFHLNGENKEISDKPFKEAEIVYYPHTKCLGIQGHPEMMWAKRESDAETFKYLENLIDLFINNKL